MIEEQKGTNVEQGVIDVMKACGIDVALTLPCDRMKKLLPLIPRNFQEIPLSREETGVGIAAGLSMAGRRPALVIQSTGIGNSLNVLLSLHKTYGLPLPILASWRGVYKENIPAQVPFGECLPGVLDGAGIPHVIVERPDELATVHWAIEAAFELETPYVVLFSPKIWEGSTARDLAEAPRPEARCFDLDGRSCVPAAVESRFDLIKGSAPYLRGKIVVSNIGVPSKELYAALDQPTNFYMLGSWGLATPIGTGLALGKPEREVVVLDGDGSLLFEPNALGMAAQLQPENLTIVAFDNTAHGSTGNQRTYSASMDLGQLARAYGLRQTAKAATAAGLLQALERLPAGPRFIHVPTLAANAEVREIPRSPADIRREFMDAIRP